ncbi:Actin-related protein 2/3 complex subunit 2 [Penicillium capsulatum]|uniref:Arp2/3 complex 34 kDa subunit n=1 Tax=Penicillium capsulatum TaxID=69766 RepID=A0A9W9LFN1_9EURO|nr:Actin-related protein 2/3 complex subunit 2 [Penicillium capsulatum]
MTIAGCGISQPPSRPFPSHCAQYASPGLSERVDSVPPDGAVRQVRLYSPLPSPMHPRPIVYTLGPQLTVARSASPASIDQVVSDFDGVTFHVSTPEAKTKILISINVKCFKELVQYGAQAVLEREYGPYIVTPEPGYDFSVQIDLENLPAEQEARDDLIMKLALMKRNAMAAPFERAFDEFTKLAEEASQYTSESAPQGVKEGGEVMSIHYREEEAIYVKASYDRVTVIFSTVFREETDRIFGKVFLQEFVDARRRVVTLQNAPQVLFRNDPPLELEGVPGLKNTGEGQISYVTFVLFPRHLTPQRRYDNISHIQTFRDYFHYHIKASKAYIHTRMRKRTADFLQGMFRPLLCMNAANKPQSSTEPDQRTKSASARRPVAGHSVCRARMVIASC